MTDLSNPGLELATALEGIETLKRERAEYQHEWKRSMERLQGDVARLRGEIISGQKRLFTVEHDVEENGQHIAEVIEVPGAMAYGDTPEEAEQKAVAIAEEVKADDLLDDAITFCREKGHAAVSELAHRFDLGPSAAMHLIDALADLGHLEPADGFGPRKFKEGA